MKLSLISGSEISCSMSCNRKVQKNRGKCDYHQRFEKRPLLKQLLRHQSSLLRSLTMLSEESFLYFSMKYISIFTSKMVLVKSTDCITPLFLDQSPCNYRPLVFNTSCVRCCNFVKYIWTVTERLSK